MVHKIASAVTLGVVALNITSGLGLPLSTENGIDGSGSFAATDLVPRTIDEAPLHGSSPPMTITEELEFCHQALSELRGDKDKALTRRHAPTNLVARSFQGRIKELEVFLTQNKAELESDAPPSNTATPDPRFLQTCYARLLGALELMKTKVGDDEPEAKKDLNTWATTIETRLEELQSDLGLKVTLVDGKVQYRLV